jgi:hypothetical protein
MPTAQQTIPLTILIAPFPEGFEGNLDETFQQACALMSAYIQGNLLTGLILPPGSTLPTSDVGPIAMGGQWYFWDPTTNQYLPQSAASAGAKNYVKNSVYQIQQVNSAFSLSAGGVIPIYDMALARVTAGNVLAIAADTGPPATGDNDFISTSIRYTVQGGNLVPTLAATDLYAHEHLIEGCDLAPLQGQVLSLSFSAWTNTPGIYSVYLTSPGRDMSYVANFNLPVANTWYRVKIAAIPALPTGTGTWHFGEGQTGLYIGFAMGVGSQWKTASLNSWQAGLYCGSASNINMLTTLNQQLKITGIKLEIGSAPTHLAVPSFESDFHDAIRYYWSSFNYQSTSGGVGIIGQAHVTNAALFSATFPRRMCRVPTVTPYGWTTYASGKVTNVSTGTDYTAATLGAVAKGVVATVSTGITATKGDTFAAFVIADARLS